MTRALLCTGVLGGGTAVVFALAFLASALFPQGAIVTGGWNGGIGIGKPMPAIGNAIGSGWATDDVVGRDGTVVAPAAVPAPVVTLETRPPDGSAQPGS